MSEQYRPLNGFAVCALVLSTLAFIGTFYVYLARGVALSHPIHLWFQMLFPSGPVLLMLSLTSSITGLITCKRYPPYTGKHIALVALVLSVLAMIHWLGWVLLAQWASGFG